MIYFNVTRTRQESLQLYPCLELVLYSYLNMMTLICCKTQTVNMNMDTVNSKKLQ